MLTGMAQILSKCRHPAIVFLLFGAFGIGKACAADLLNFDRFKGHWGGLGLFTFGDGHEERAHCFATVRSYGRPNRGGIDLVCGVPHTNIAGRAYDVTLKGPQVSGSFEWPAYGITGIVTGEVTETSFAVVLRP